MCQTPDPTISKIFSFPSLRRQVSLWRETRFDRMKYKRVNSTLCCFLTPFKARTSAPEVAMRRF